MAPGTTLEWLAHHASTSPQRAAYRRATDALPYGQFAANARRAVTAVAALGVVPGGTVLISHADPLVHWLLVVAAEALGATTVSYNGRDSLGRSGVLDGATFVISDDEPPPGIGRIPCARITAEWLQLLTLLPPDAPLPEAASHTARGVSRITHSSGTTGSPRAIALSAEVQDARLRTLQAIAGITAASHVRCTLALSVNSSYLLAALAARTGATLSFGSLGDAPAAGVTYAETLPVMLDQTLAGLPLGAGASAMRVTVIGAPLPDRARQRARDLLCGQITGRYGTNEVWPIAHDVDASGEGTLVPELELRVLDEFGVPVPAGRPGLIAVRAPTMATGYLDDAGATAQHFRDGWFHTNDLGATIGAGRLRILGRADEVLNRGGLKLAPSEVEDALRTHPGIREAAAVMAQDDARLVVAIAGPGSISPRELVALVERASGAWPAVEVRQVDALPRTAAGKVDRRAVRALVK